MNYFAHAAVATRVRPDAAFVLGAMLPDFAQMIGVRLSGLAHPELRSGERHHRRTDAAFHASPAFLALVREACAALSAAGLGRGPARAAAHVGVELLLDGALVGDPRAAASYLDALAAAPELESAITWSDTAGPRRWRRLQARLRANGPPYALRDPLRVTGSLARAVASRPRLRLAPRDRTIVARWVAGARPRVAGAAPRLLAETLATLARTGAIAARTRIREDLHGRRSG